MGPSMRDYLDFITETAYLAGKVTLAHFQTDLTAEIKMDGSPVTIADRSAEELIRKRIEQRFPEHTIVGEEFGEQHVQKSTHSWYIDPIDGTRSFIRGVPLYAVLIGLEIEGRVEAGAAYFPALNEMVAAASGEGCWWNGRAARVSQISQLNQGVAAFTSVGRYPEEKKAAVERIIKRANYSRGWGDAYGYALVATGRAELMVDPIMSVWDCGPFPPILREAGGFFGDWLGNETIHAGEAFGTSQYLLPEVLKLLHDDNIID
ncbi:MAG: inositol monophosphatase family protein [Anaerolineaceae bacterium]|nr:inositol monophosphatase family protein [Anaerolineaceae bacterium]